MEKKIRLYEEPVFVLATVSLAFAVSMIAAADFGVSVVVAPAYLVSLKYDLVTFGQAEYILQGIIFIALCAIMRTVKPVYLFSFVSCLFYGAVLDVCRAAIPFLNPAVCEPGSFPLPARFLMFFLGMLMGQCSVALYLKVYIYPQVYELFVKKVSWKLKISLTKFKMAYDCGSLVLSGAMSLLFFGKLEGIGAGTLVMALVSGVMVGAFAKLLSKCFDFVPIFPKLKAWFEADVTEAR